MVSFVGVYGIKIYGCLSAAIFVVVKAQALIVLDVLYGLNYTGAI